MAKPKTKTTTRTTQTEEGAQTTTTTTQEAPSYMPKLSSVEEQRKEQFDQELEESAAIEQKKHELRIIENRDLMSTWLRKLFRLASFPVPMFKYKDSRFPVDDKGHRMSVSRFYSSLSLVVDKIPVAWTEEMILAKKWAVEAMGLRYVWQQEGEIVKIVNFPGEGGTVIEQMVVDKGFDDEGKPVYNNFWNRYDKIKKKPEFTFSTKPFSFETNIIGGQK